MSDTVTGTLTDFLLARIAEDEVSAPRWHDIECDVPGIDNLADLAMSAEVPGVLCDCNGPSRVLAECEAKRRIVEEHPTAQAYADNGALMEECRRCSSHSYEGLDDEVVEYPCPTLRLLAVPYADQPDYREEWRP